MSKEGIGSPRWVASVSARRLGRDTAAILQRVAEKRHPILVTRGGLPVAILQPLDGVGFQPFHTDADGNVQMQNAPQVDLDSYDLSEGARRFLIALDDGLHYLRALRFAPDEAQYEMLGTLEVRRLIDKQLTSYSLTSQGRAVVEALRAEGWTKEGRSV